MSDYPLTTTQQENRDDDADVREVEVVDLPALTDRQQAFVAAFVGPCRFNATQAALAVGYANGFKAGWRLSNNVHVRAHVDAYLDAMSATAGAVLAELTNVAFAPMAMFQQVLNNEYTDEKGRTHPQIVRTDLSSKVKALEVLAKARGLLNQQIDVTITETKTIVGLNINDL